MALLQIFKPAPSSLPLYEDFDVIALGDSGFQLRGVSTGWRLTFVGTGFEYEDEDLVRGAITGYEYAGPDGAVFFKVSGLAITVQDLISQGVQMALDKLALGGADTVLGSAGDDTLSGLEGSDLVIGGAGNDLLHALDSGLDTLAGGIGNDLYQINADDTIQEAPGEGIDSVQLVAGSAYDPQEILATYVMSDDVEHLATMSNGVRVVGNALANRLEASSYIRGTRLDGMDGDDTLTANFDRVTLAGGNGDDYYELLYSANGSLGLTLYEEAGGGYDTVYALNVAMVQLPDHFEKLVLSPTASTAIGSAQDNLIVREGGNWSYLDGGAGVDSLVGGSGNDTFVIDDSRDVIVLGGGVDDVIVRSSGLTMPSGIHTMWMEGAAHLAYGSALDDRIMANILGESTIYGGDGNDTLTGGMEYPNTYGMSRAPHALYGGRGDDWLLTAGGTGLLEGGSGWDIATLPSGQYSVMREGGDVLVQSYYQLDEPSLVVRGVEELRVHWNESSGRYDERIVLNVHLVQGGVGIGGDAIAGARVQSTESLTDGDGLGNFQYQWFRSDTPLAGATAASYVLTPADIGNDLRLRVEFVDGEGNLETAWSNILKTTTQLSVSEAGDQLQGGNAAEQIAALGGNDSMWGGGGNDTLRGGDGVDTSFYNGQRSEYELVRQGETTFVRDGLALRDGADQLSQVEVLRFADRTVDLRAHARAATISASDLKTIEELYVGFFDRIPEAEGLVYWIDKRAAGTSLGEIAQSFWDAGKAFGLYSTDGWVHPRENLRKIYDNVLQRPVDGPDAPTDAELQYWFDWIDYQERHSSGFWKGTYGWFGEMVLQMLHDVHAGFEGDPKYGYVPALLNNKAALANYYAIEQGLGSTTPTESIEYGQKLADLVVPEGIDAAIEFIGVSPVTVLPQ